MAASVKRLGQLHERITELMLEDIELCRSEGIPMSAADKQVIVSFLKANNITAAPDDDGMQLLREEFKGLAEQRNKLAAGILKASKAEAQQEAASDAFLQGLLQ